MELSANWRLQHFDAGQTNPAWLSDPGLDDRFWMTAKVPGDVHSTLIERQIIEHPFYGHNDLKCRWIEEKEWWYRTQFNYRLEPQESESYELIFEGLDTFATIYVNGKEIASTDNMHRGYRFDVTRLLQSGKNVIAVQFDPLYLHHQNKERMQWSSYTKERPWLRKAAMNFGWDWGPRIVTVGIWGKVRLERHTVASLDSVFARTIELSEDKAVVRVSAELKAAAFSSRNTPLECFIRLRDREGRVVGVAHELGLAGRSIEAELEVRQPQLWWTHDLGEPYLYELELELKEPGGRELHVVRQKLGIRTIELKLKEADGSDAFAFLLNGVRLFAKGANWIPVDNLIGAASDTRYADLLELAVEANMNMLRIWAGGIYEKDVFYDECDRRGILVWQDFAFANALFPDYNANFMANVRQEAIYNIKRLRSHASLALWCGNNEIDWLYDMKSSDGDITCPFYGEVIYHELLPEVLEELDPSRPYWPSSPYGGSDANDPEVGDRHNWQVWHGSVYPRRCGERTKLDYSIEGVTFKNYKQDFTLFSSEFGMHASANRYTLEHYLPDGEFYWNSVEMAYRNKDTNHQKGLLLMEGYTGLPTDIEDYMNYSMLTQAEGLKYGIEHYRRNKHRTSGSLIWQHNDSWPGTSWSLIDYALLGKASYFYAARFYHPQLLTLEHEPGEPLAVWLVNDRLEGYTGMVTLTCRELTGAVVHTATFRVQAAPNGAVKLGELAEAEALQGREASQVVVTLTADHWDGYENRYYLRDHKDMRFPEASLSCEVDERAGTVTVAAGGSVARMVKIDIAQPNVRFADNFFDLLPGERRVIALRQADGQPLRLDTVRVGAINAASVVPSGGERPAAVRS